MTSKLKQGEVLKAKGRGRPSKNINKQLITAARTEFLEQGYNNASLDNIVVKAATTKPTLYRRFKGKDALFEAVMMDALGDLASLDIDFNDAPSTALLGVAHYYYSQATSPKGLALSRFLLAESHHFPSLTRRVHQRIEEYYLGPLEKYLNYLVDNKILAIPNTLEAAINFATLSRGGTRSLIGIKLTDPQRDVYLEEVVRFFMAGYAP